MNNTTSSQINKISMPIGSIPSIKIIPHMELSEENRYQAISETKEGYSVIVFGHSHQDAFSKAVKQISYPHVFNVSRVSRFKKCVKCDLLIKEN